MLNPLIGERMTTKALIGLISGLAIVAVVMVYVWMSISYSNQEIVLRNSAAAQEEKCKAYYDKLWKIIQQKAEVADEYKTAFASIYESLIQGRYSKEQGGSLMRFIQEANPNFDPSLYKDLAQSIEGQREGFFVEQNRLIDIDRQHKNLRYLFPGSFFLSGTQDLKITIITSSTTKEVYSTGEENDVNVMRKK